MNVILANLESGIAQAHTSRDQILNIIENPPNGAFMDKHHVLGLEERVGFCPISHLF
jgi:hypothetical protein